MDFKIPELTPINNLIKNIDVTSIKHPTYAVAEENYASEFYKKIIERINDFDSTLDNKQEVGMRLVSFGQNVTFAVAEIGYSNPSLIIFRGISEDGSQLELIQHITQISFLLMAMNRKSPELPKRQIGFIPLKED